MLLLVHDAGMETQQAHQGDSDPADYVWPSMIAALLNDDWQVERDEQRPRIAPEGRGRRSTTPTTLVLRARRLR